VDTDSTYHHATLAIVRSKRYERIIPAPVLPEISYLLAKRMGHAVLRSFITNIAVEKPKIADLEQQDYEHVATVLDEYADLRLDFADAAILALAERLNIQQIFTLDRRDFRVLRPKHCQYFELLP
jgi:predicted nucleic acid-binding protein